MRRPRRRTPCWLSSTSEEYTTAMSTPQSTVAPPRTAGLGSRRPRHRVATAGRRRATLAAYTFVLPGFALYVLVMIYPAIQTLLLSFQGLEHRARQAEPVGGLRELHPRVRRPRLRRRPGERRRLHRLYRAAADRYRPRPRRPARREAARQGRLPGALLPARRHQLGGRLPALPIHLLLGRRTRESRGGRHAAARPRERELVPGALVGALRDRSAWEPGRASAGRC